MLKQVFDRSLRTILLAASLVWFRDDLGVTDNPTLADAVDSSGVVIPPYIFDSRDQNETQYGTAKCGPHPTAFRRESVQDLRASLRDLGGSLIVRQGRPEDILPELPTQTDAEAVSAQTKPATEEGQREQRVRDAPPEAVSFEDPWTHTLYHLAALPRPVEEMEDTFTPWHTVDRNSAVRPVRWG